MVESTSQRLRGTGIKPYPSHRLSNVLKKKEAQDWCSRVVMLISDCPNLKYYGTIMNNSYLYQSMKHRELQHLLHDLAGEVYKIATDKIGCCIIQSCVEYSRGLATECTIDEILSNAMSLSGDPYGNYVMQHLLEGRIPKVTANICRRLGGFFASLSCDKYASNVVERLLVESEEENVNKIVMELVTDSNASMLLLDPYGNFVIQAALSVSKDISLEVQYYSFKYHHHIPLVCSTGNPLNIDSVDISIYKYYSSKSKRYDTEDSP